MSQGRGYRRREEEKQVPWVPRTKLGSMVSEGKITTLSPHCDQTGFTPTVTVRQVEVRPAANGGPTGPSGPTGPGDSSGH